MMSLVLSFTLKFDKGRPTLLAHVLWHVVVTPCRCSTLGLVSTRMDNHLQADQPFRQVISHPGQLSLAIPLWVDVVARE